MLWFVSSNINGLSGSAAWVNLNIPVRIYLFTLLSQYTGIGVVGRTIYGSLLLKVGIFKFCIPPF